MLFVALSLAFLSLERSPHATASEPDGSSSGIPGSVDGSSGSGANATESPTLQAESDIRFPGNETLQPIPSEQLQVNTETGPSLSLKSIGFKGSVMSLTVAHRKGLSSSYTGKLIFKASNKGRILTVGQKSIALQAGQQVVLKVKLNAAAKRALIGKAASGSKLLVDFKASVGIARRLFSADIRGAGSKTSLVKTNP